MAEDQKQTEAPAKEPAKKPTRRATKEKAPHLPGFNPEWAKFHDSGAPTKEPVQGNESL